MGISRVGVGMLLAAVSFGCNDEPAGSAPPPATATQTKAEPSATQSASEPAVEKQTVDPKAARARVATLKDARGLLPEPDRERATVVFLGSYYERSGPHIHTGDMSYWPLVQGFDVVEVLEGSVRAKSVGTHAPSNTPGVKEQLYVVALRPTAESMRRLAEASASWPWDKPLSGDEVLAIVPVR